MRGVAAEAHDTLRTPVLNRSNHAAPDEGRSGLKTRAKVEVRALRAKKGVKAAIKRARKLAAK